MSLVTAESWKRLWGELGAREVNGGLMNQLVAAYSERHRHYHTLQHLRECLALFEAASPVAARPAEVELALWFHDAVYDPQASDNEARSAAWAEASVRAAGCDAAIAQRVAALVQATAHEAPPAVTGPDVDLLLDIDLAILGAAPARFDEYEQQVRLEYAHVPDEAFRSRRAALLRALLARPALYRTEVFRTPLEATARANLHRSLDTLSAPAA